MPSSHVDSFKLLLVLYHAHPVKQEVRFCVSVSPIDGCEELLFPCLFLLPKHTNTRIQVTVFVARGNSVCQDQHVPVPFQGPSQPPGFT